MTRLVRGARVPAVVLLAVSELFCARSRAASPSPSQSAPQATITPVRGFVFADSLECKVVVATYPYAVGTTLRVEGASSASAVVAAGGEGGKPMARIRTADGRVVFQASDEDPGSVDTLSIDSHAGVFARVWSGWSREPVPMLSAGVERGVCGPVSPSK